MARTWTCQRVTNGVKCGAKNRAIYRLCRACNKPRPPLRKTAAQKALTEPYEAWAEIYGDRCGICGAVAKPGGKRLHRDHEHGSGLPRGILCFRCNSALRPYMTARWLRQAAYYLDRAEEIRRERAA
jgi:hypothetical protein